jgi:prevent-host-death family protein
MTMIMVNIHQLKARLSEFLEHVKRGERVVICHRNQPIAEMVPLEQKRSAPRPIGGGPYQYDVPDTFFEPMPEDFLTAVESGPVFPDRRIDRPRVAESKPPYGTE